MARVSSYSTLATAVQAYLHRADVGVSAGNLDFLCAEAEQEMNARLRVRRMRTVVTPTVSSSGVVTLPTDFAGWKRFSVRNGSQEWDLDLKDAEEVPNVSMLYGGTGEPEALITVGSTSQVWPFTNGVYTFAGLYFAKIPELTVGAPTNWVITNYPMAYLYGCLAAAQMYVKDDKPAMASRFEMWGKRFDRVLTQIDRDNAKEIDSRTNATLVADTSLFAKRGHYHVMSDS